MEVHRGAQVGATKMSKYKAAYTLLAYTFSNLKDPLFIIHCIKGSHKKQEEKVDRLRQIVEKHCIFLTF